MVWLHCIGDGRTPSIAPTSSKQHGHWKSVAAGGIEAFRLFDIQNIGGMPAWMVPVTVQKNSVEALTEFVRTKIAYYMKWKGYKLPEDREFTLVKCIEKPKKPRSTLPSACLGGDQSALSGSWCQATEGPRPACL